MRSLVYCSIAAMCLALAAPPALSQQKDERAGSCADAKSQMEYFCDPSRGAGDTMVAVGTACENAKKNVAAACEGKVEEDKPYKFDK
jgi:hypothetical protein